jgi:parallel beta-helix repeat protein
MAIADNVILEIIQNTRKEKLQLNDIGQTNHESRNDLPNSDLTTRYISKSGSDSNDGSTASPVLTISQANTLCNSSGYTKIFFTSDGYWDEQLELSTGITTISTVGDISPAIRNVDATIPDAQLEDLSDINRHIFQEYNNAFYVACESGGDVDLIYNYSSGWAERKDLNGENILCVGASTTTAITGCYFGTDNGKIIKFTDIETESTVYNSSGTAIRGIAEHNNYIYAVSSGTVQEVLRSSDGSTFSAVSDNFDDLALGTQTIRAVASFNNRLTVAFDYSVLTSNDGQTFTVRKTFDWGSFTAKRLFNHDGYLYVVGSAGGVWRSKDDLESWTQVFDGTVEYSGIAENEHLYIITTSGDLYRSTDGVNFTLVKSGLDAYLGVYEDFLYMGDQKWNDYFLKLQSDVEINNISFITRIGGNAIYADSNNPTIKYSSFQDFQLYPIKDAANLTIENLKINDCENGVEVTGTLSAKNNVIYNIEEKAINHSGTSAMIENNTIYNVDYGFYLSGSLTTSNIKNNIFYHCRSGLYSVGTVTMQFCVYARCSLGDFVSTQNCTIGNPLFVNTDEGSEDLQIKTSVNYDILDSPAKQFGDDGKDAGAYDFQYTEHEKDAIEIELDIMPLGFAVRMNRSDFLTKQTLAGAPSINFSDCWFEFDLNFPQQCNISATMARKIQRLQRNRTAVWYKPANQSGYTDNSGDCTVQMRKIDDYPEAMAELEIKNPDYEVCVLEDAMQSWDEQKWAGWTLTLNDGDNYRIIYSGTDYLILDADITDNGSYVIEKIKCRISSNLSMSTIFYDGLEYSYPYNNFNLTLTEVI